ncbi:phage terminase small subunit P27 family [Methylocystis sp. MJC1]|uniref:phage terminase small subunit P27 family n=1 Tax=Methylocystis sp. MJC1 TaxID=2654282 RepID=UPI0013EAB20B|nr:phage terminase small subunit P27 family [Methylocystis sp. MJC1]MBU6525935.1 phage terminase small subunit P27 family [Methylocystis sp. MJC1]UZX12401.1 phage terminase small subunit P27 family [Methylocystis sp. MJC1]
MVNRVARALWVKLHEELASIRFLQSTDYNALGRYVQYMAEWISLTDTLEKEGHSYKTSSEHVEELVRPRPEFRMRKDIEACLASLEDRLGLNPRYRFAITQALLATKAPPPPGQADLPLAGDDDAAETAIDAKSEWERLLGASNRPH